MRLLFISGTTVGGSGRSQRELAGQLVSRGHTVSFLVDDAQRAPVTRWLYGHLSDLSVRLAGTRLASASTWLRTRLGRRTSSVTIGGLHHQVTAVPQNALPVELRGFRPDVVVANSVERWAWRLIQKTCRAVLVANAHSLADRLRDQGFECAFVPSVVDVSVTRTESSRRVALAINPARSRGGDIVWALAESLPWIPFVVQESWPLSDEELEEVRRHTDALPNVEFRRAVPPGPGLYGDARVLLVPYRVDNRPRVILEAQSNAIPVIVGDVPALIEAIGDGGISVPLESIDAWVAAVRSLWEEGDRYTALAGCARAQSRRPDVEPGAVTRSFEDLLQRVVDKEGV